jgi:hypothetical protein
MAVLRIGIRIIIAGRIRIHIKVKAGYGLLQSETTETDPVPSKVATHYGAMEAHSGEVEAHSRAVSPWSYRESAGQCCRFLSLK